VREQQNLFAQVEIRHRLAQPGQILPPVAGKPAVHAEQAVGEQHHAEIAAAGRLEQREAAPARQIVLGDAHLEPLAPVLHQSLGELADVVEGLVGRAVLLRQHLHDEIRVHDEAALVPLVKPVLGRDPVGEGHIEHRIVERAARRIVVEDLDLAELRRAFQKTRDVLPALHEQAHAEVLIRRAVALRTDIGDIELILSDELQNRLHRAGHVAQMEFDQNDVPETLVRQIADLAQAALGLPDGLGLALDVDKEHVRVDRLVVAHARDVEPEPREDAARGQKCPDLVGHDGGKGFFHMPVLIHTRRIVPASRRTRTVPPRPPRQTGS